MSELPTVMCARENCASARVHVGVLSTHSVVFMAQDWTCRQNSQVDFDNVEFVAYACCFQLLLERELMLSYFTIGLTELHHVGQLHDDDGCGRSEFCGSANSSA